MATKVYAGTGVKLNVSIEPIDDIRMSDYPFVITIYTTPSKSFDIKKEEAIQVDADNYIVCFDTTNMGIGQIKCKVTAQLPDEDFDGDYRTEIAVIDTGIEIIK